MTFATGRSQAGTGEARLAFESLLPDGRSRQRRQNGRVALGKATGFQPGSKWVRLPSRSAEGKE